MHSTSPLLIGLTGLPGVGKDTCAQLLEQHGFQSTAFSEALYVEIARGYHVDVDMLQHRSTKEWPLSCLAVAMCTDPRFIARMAELGHELYVPRSPRWTLQQWGSEYRRAQEPAYWLTCVSQWIGRQRNNDSARLVVRDVKLQNEADLVRHLGGEVWRVHSHRASALTGDTVRHESEVQAAAIAVDDDVLNDSGFPALEEELQRAMDRAAARAQLRRIAA